MWREPRFLRRRNWRKFTFSNLSLVNVQSIVHCVGYLPPPLLSRECLKRNPRFCGEKSCVGLSTNRGHVILGGFRFIDRLKSWFFRSEMENTGHYMLIIVNHPLISSVRSSSGYHGLLEIRQPLFQIFQILQIRK